MNWLKYLNDIYNTSSSIVINGDEPVIVVEKTYMTRLVQLLGRTPTRTIANYVLWRFVKDLAKETDQKTIDLANQFRRNFIGSKEPEPRWRKCVDLVDQVMGYAVGSKYVSRYFDGRVVHEVCRIVNLKNTP